MENSRIPKQVESNYIAEASLDLTSHETQVHSEGAFSDERSNKSMALAWINEDLSYNIEARSESKDFVGVCGRNCQGFLQVFAQSGRESKAGEKNSPNKEASSADKKKMKKKKKKKISSKEDDKDKEVQVQENLKGEEIGENLVTKIVPMQRLKSSTPNLQTHNTFDALLKLDQHSDKEDEEDDDEDVDNDKAVHNDEEVEDSVEEVVQPTAGYKYWCSIL